MPVTTVLEVGAAADRALPLDRSGLAERQKPLIVPVSTIRRTCRRLSLVSSQRELELKFGSGYKVTFARPSLRHLAGAAAGRPCETTECR